MDAEKEFERIKNKYKRLIENWGECCETLKDINFLINTLDTMNKRAKINSYKSRFNVLYGKTYYNDTDSFNITRGQRGYGQFMYAMDKLFNEISKSDKSKFTIIKDKGLIFLVEEELKEIDKVPEKFTAIYIIPSDEYDGFWGKNGYKSFDFIFEYKGEKIGWIHWEGDVINIVCKHEYGIRIDSNIEDGFIRLFSNKELEISDLIVSDITISLRGEM